MVRKRKLHSATASSLTEFKPGRILLVLLTGACIWFADAYGAFRAIDRPIYDLLMQLRGQQNPAPANVLMVRLDEADRIDDSGYMVKLLRQIEAAHSSLIVFLRTPAGEEREAFLEACRGSRTVLVAVPLRRDRFERGVFEFVDDYDSESQLTVGATHPPANEGGISRRQRTRFRTDEGLVPSLEAVIVDRVLGTGASPHADDFLVDFRGGAGSLPYIDASRALTGDLIPELVRNRCVLVGSPLDHSDVGIAIPGVDEPVSQLQFHAHAVNTLLSGRVTQSLPPMSRLAVLCLLMTLSYLVYRVLSVSVAYSVTIGLIVIYCAAGVMLFNYANTWVHVPQLVIGQFVIFLAFLRGRVVDLAAGIQQLLGVASRRLHDKAHAVDPLDSQPSWALVGHMIDQTLDLNRLILMQTEPKEGRLKEVGALRCVFQDVAEKRRDYRRSPYSDAVEANKAIRVDGFFGNAEPDEDQYLIPLVFAGELLGFWAFGVNTFKAAAIPRFEEILRHFSARICELLYRTTQQEHRGSVRTFLGRTIIEEKTERNYSNLSFAFRQVGNQLDTLQHLVDQLDIGVIVYDIFGRLLHANERMMGYLKAEEIAPYGMTALDLLLALTDVDPSNGKRVLRRAIVEEVPTQFSVDLASEPDRVFSMQVKPLVQTVNTIDNESSGVATRASLIFELIDTTQVNQLSEMRSALTERFLVQMRRDLSTIGMSASLLESIDMPVEHCYQMGTIIHSRVGEAFQSVSDCEQYLCGDEFAEELERFPVDPLPMLKLAVEEAQKAAEVKGIKVELWEPGTTRYTLASTAELRFLFIALLDALLEDAVEDSVILVRFAGHGDLVGIDFSNTGFGIPNESLHNYLHSDDEAASEHFAKIRKGAEWVEEWGGTFEAVSGVGVGLHFTIRLARFM